MRVRLAACRTLLEKLRLDAVLVSDEADIRYLSGFRGEDALLVIASTEASLCTDARFWGQAAEEAPDFTLVRAQKGLFASAVAALHGSLGQGVRLGFQGASLSYERYRALRRLHDGPLRNVGQRIAHLRIIKDDREIATMRRAAAVTDCALAEVVGSGLIGRSERDVAWGLAAAFHRLGAEGEAFPAIVAAGEHGAQAHAIPGDRIIRPGDLVVIDTGARVDGYCSDTTRTYAAGEPPEEARRIYDVVLRAQLAGLAALKPGAHGRDDVDAACRSVIEEAGYGDHFGHGTGHGVGLCVHEEPSLGRTVGDRLAAGMVCTVEPGIYVDGFCGVRIEDTVLVTATGCEPLTRLTKDLQVVD